jgi:hypothetical protein
MAASGVAHLALPGTRHAGGLPADREVTAGHHLTTDLARWTRQNTARWLHHILSGYLA